MRSIKLPVGRFWLVADGKRIDFKAIDVTKDCNEIIAKMSEKNEGVYSIKKAIVVRPNLPAKFHYDNLFIKSTSYFGEKNAVYGDGDEWYEYEVWELKDNVVGIGIQVDNDQLDYHVGGINVHKSDPYYYKNVDDSFRVNLSFEIVYKDANEYLNADEWYEDSGHMSEYYDCSFDESFDEMALTSGDR